VGSQDGGWIGGSPAHVEQISPAPGSPQPATKKHFPANLNFLLIFLSLLSFLSIFFIKKHL
jgi:hypothetical protein